MANSLDLKNPVVAIFKSSSGDKGETSNDRYLNILRDNNFIGFSIPTLQFNFQLDHLIQCLQVPPNYSGKLNHDIVMINDRFYFYF